MFLRSIGFLVGGRESMWDALRGGDNQDGWNVERMATLIWYGSLQPQPQAAISLIHQQPVRWTKERKVSCDGGGGPLGHPRIFINVDKPQINWCTYCGLPFVSLCPLVLLRAGEVLMELLGFGLAKEGMLMNSWTYRQRNHTGNTWRAYRRRRIRLNRLEDRQRFRRARG